MSGLNFAAEYFQILTHNFNIMKKLTLSALLLLLVAFVSSARDITVQGTVVSATDAEPLIGASVISELKSNVGVSTDLDGNFTLVVPEGSNIVVSYVGFKSKTVAAAETVTIELEENAALLDEIV